MYIATLVLRGMEEPKPPECIEAGIVSRKLMETADLGAIILTAVAASPSSFCGGSSCAFCVRFSELVWEEGMWAWVGRAKTK